LASFAVRVFIRIPLVAPGQCDEYGRICNSERLRHVWLEIAANLRPNLARPKDALARDAEANDWWETADLDQIETPSESAILNYLLGGVGRVPGAERARSIKSIKEAQAKGNYWVLFEAMLRREVGRLQASLNAELDAELCPSSRTLQGRFENGPYWLQCRGCFVAIINKVEEDNDAEADLIMLGLREALLDWQPNFLQLLISEIQNRLELESLAADPRTFSDQVRQVALSHYLLQSLDEENDEEGSVEAVVDRIVETVRNKISADTKLRAFARKVLTQRRAALKAGLANPDILARAQALAHVTAVPKPEDILPLPLPNC
jgi:hypothetical protein